jgi:CubicO group peptidase (beta-lactamase class C family)
MPVVVTGQDFPTLAAELVLEAAGMRDSTFAQPLPAQRSADAACGHHPGPVMVPGGWRTYPELAAGGLWSTWPASSWPSGPACSALTVRCCHSRSPSRWRHPACPARRTV